MVYASAKTGVSVQHATCQKLVVRLGRKSLLRHFGNVFRFVLNTDNVYKPENR